MFIKPASKALLFVWIIFVIFAVFDEFYFLPFLLLVLASFVFRHPAREAALSGKILSPIDGEVIKIFADEEAKELCVLLKTLPCSSTLVCAPTQTASLSVAKNAAPKLISYAQKGCCELGFDSGVSAQIYPRFRNICLADRFYDIASGNCVGYVLSAYVLLRLPYEAVLETGLNERVKAASAIARIE